ncbi:MAG: COX15/CtaA family protein [Actinobacteria bacterium]|nr:COX15/CtaA family protein [Actinomycetota bacterium]
MTTSAPAPSATVAARPSRTLVRLAVAAVAVNVAIVVTGGIVRVTGSGLGCPDWPSCDGTRVVPQAGSEAGWHAAVEFGNRLMTFLVLAVVVWLYVELRRRRPDSRARSWAGWLIVGVLGQGVLGGITVRMDLHPLTVAAHFLASMVLLVLAMVVHHLLTRGTRPEHTSPALRRVVAGIVLGAVAVIVVGTLVTASGPHAGDPGTPRLGLDIRTVARVHTTAVWTTVVLTVVGLVAARRGHAGPTLTRALGLLLTVELLQGAVGYTQYLLGIPAWLVALHLLGACLFWVATLRAGLVALGPADGA